MLLLREKTATINNITFFADDADENQFWYMPGDLHIAQKDRKPVFSLIKYTGDGSNQQGGYLNFEVNTALDETTLNSAFRTYLSQMKIAAPQARKAPVPFDSGTVDFFVLDVKNGNGQLISAQSPSLFGNNSAIFSAKLTPEQAVILEAAFNQAQAPAAVAYNLTYTGITPALKVEVKAEFDSIYKEFGAKFGINIPIPVETPASFWLGFDAVIKKLQQDQKLVITVTESLPDEQAAKEKEWALQFVKEELLKSFFDASIKPNAESNEQSKSARDAILDALISNQKKAQESGGGKSDEGGEGGGGEGGGGGEAGKGGLFPCASLELKVVRIEEVKRLNVNYTSSRAITQSAVPQNFIGSKLLQAPKAPPYYIEVNVNDPFFQKIDLTVLGPDGFDDYGIKAASFKLAYNNSVYTTAAFTHDDSQWSQTVARSGNANELFDLQGEFAFKTASTSGWEGSTSYLQQTQTASQLINLDPSTFLSFNTINIMLDKKLVWDNYNQIVVEINYQDDSLRKKTKKYTFTADNRAMQTFKYRCPTEKPWRIEYSVTYFEAGGDTRTVQGNPNPAAIIVSA
ncbi:MULTISPECIES: hypothetical protein [Dickeya]|uniref:Uncharacterized protein n=1 Tax=Dickeya aquatica TaxID=1401087 RepID=A0A375A9F3_9GAMM|nr:MULTISPECIES: hypothetical protein [Dickeya]SLM62581.1 hypothetical protein DAQ1742_01624 [Dickeya aquatica]